MIQQHSYDAVNLKRIHVPGVAAVFKSVGYKLQKYFCVFTVLVHALSEVTCSRHLCPGSDRPLCPEAPPPPNAESL